MDVKDDTLMTFAQYKELIKNQHTASSKKWYCKLTPEEKKERASVKIMCKCCNVEIYRTNKTIHCRTKKHVDNHNRMFPDNKLEFSTKTSTYQKNKEEKEDKNVKFCTICNKNVNKYYYEKHLVSKSHKKKLEEKTK